LKNQGAFRLPQSVILCGAGGFLGLFAGALINLYLFEHVPVLVAYVVSFIITLTMEILFKDFAEGIESR